MASFNYRYRVLAYLKNGGINKILMISYSFSIISIEIFLSRNGSVSKSSFIILSSCVLGVLIYICPKLFNKIKLLDIGINEKSITKKK